MPSDHSDAGSILDGSKTTQWHAGDASGETGVDIILPVAVPIRSITFKGVHLSFSVEFGHAEATQDGRRQAWSKPMAISASTVTTQTWTLKSAITARSIRITPSDKVSTIQEVEIWAEYPSASALGDGFSTSVLCSFSTSSDPSLGHVMMLAELPNGTAPQGQAAKHCRSASAWQAADKSKYDVIEPLFQKHSKTWASGQLCLMEDVSFPFEDRWQSFVYGTEWVKSDGSFGIDSTVDVKMDFLGDVFLGGTTKGHVRGQPYHGGSDIFITKYTNGGSPLWTVQKGSLDGFDLMQAMEMDSFGNVIVVGDTDGAWNGIQHGGRDVFVLKLDTKGQVLWTKTLGTSSDDFAYQVKVDASGIYLAGKTLGVFEGQTNKGGADVFTMKLDADGQVVWVSQEGSPATDHLYQMQLHSGNVYMVGKTWGQLSKGESTDSSGKIFLLKYDGSGAKQWQVQTGSKGLDHPSHLRVDASENVFLAGDTTGAFKDASNLGGVDIFVSKYNSSGAAAADDRSHMQHAAKYCIMLHHTMSP